MNYQDVVSLIKDLENNVIRLTKYLAENDQDDETFDKAISVAFSDHYSLLKDILDQITTVYLVEHPAEKERFYKLGSETREEVVGLLVPCSEQDPNSAEVNLSPIDSMNVDLEALKRVFNTRDVVKSKKYNYSLISDDTREGKDYGYYFGVVDKAIEMSGMAKFVSIFGLEVIINTFPGTDDPSGGVGLHNRVSYSTFTNRINYSPMYLDMDYVKDQINKICTEGVESIFGPIDCIDIGRIIHELGHYLCWADVGSDIPRANPVVLNQEQTDYCNNIMDVINKIAMMGMSPSQYGTTSVYENISEWFTIYSLYPETVKEAAPEAYDLLTQLREALQ